MTRHATRDDASHASARDRRDGRRSSDRSNGEAEHVYAQVMALHRDAGNRRVQAAFRAAGGNPSTALTDASASLEREAQHIADDALRSRGPATDPHHTTARSEIPASIASYFTNQLGTDLREVDITRDPSGRLTSALNTNALSVDGDIVLGPNADEPVTAAGKRLIAHELAHVHQHQAGRLDKVARNPPTGAEEEVAVFEAEDIEWLVAQIIVEALTMGDDEDAPPPMGYVQAELHEAVARHFEGELVEDLQFDIGSLDLVTAWLGDQEFDFLDAAEFLMWHLGVPPEIPDPEVRVSYGVAHYVRVISRDIARYLALDINWEQLQTRFEEMVSAWGDPAGILEVELEGLLRVYVDPSTVFDEPSSEAASEELAALSREALLLYEEIERLREIGGGDDDVQDPDAVAEAVFDALANLAVARSEEETIAELGGGLELLGAHDIELEAPIGERDRYVVEPTAPFPETTASAVQEMTESAQRQVNSLAGDVTALYRVLVPEDRSYTLEQFVSVYRRWLAFFSPAARDASYEYQQMAGLYHDLVDVVRQFGGHEGGIARYFFIELFFGGGFPVPETTSPDFATELPAEDLERSSTVSGTPAAPSYTYAERFAGTTGAETPEGERQSRTQHLRRRMQEQELAFDLLDVLGAREDSMLDAAVSVGLLSPDEAAGQLVLDADDHDERPGGPYWNYLLSQEVTGESLQPTLVHEERAMPAEVAEYLLAAQQLRDALDTPHIPTVEVDGEEVRIGDFVTRFGGLRITQPDVEGFDLQPGGDLPTMEGIAGGLIRKLREYLAEYFDQLDDSTERIAATYLVAAGEHDAQEAFSSHFDLSAIASAVAQAVAMQSVIFAISRMGRYGAVLSRAITEGMKKLGAGSETQAVFALVAWFDRAGEVTTFHQARVMAVPAKDLMNELGGIILDNAIGKSIDFTKASYNLSQAPDDPLSKIDALEPLTGDRAMREVMLEEIETELGRLGSSEGEHAEEIRMLEDVRDRIEREY